MTKACPNCGKAVDSGNFCPECGANLNGGAPGAGTTVVSKTSVNVSSTEGNLPGEDTLWEGTTWPLCCVSPLCCSAVEWKVTTKRIDVTRGCCGSTMDTTDLRRVTDIRFKANPILQCCCNRGTLIVYSGDVSDPELHINTFGMKALYKKLRDAWSKARVATTVDVPDHHN